MLDRIVQQLQSYTVVLEPDENTPEWWAGAPSVCLAKDGKFYLAARMREGNSPRGRRGYEVRILESDDGKSFTPIHHIRREEAKVPGFERPALVMVPSTGLFRLYGCAPLEDRWSIIRWDDVDHPSKIDASTARRVLAMDYPDDGFARVDQFKDPFIFHHDGRWHMFVIGFDFVERIHHFISEDGDCWEPAQPSLVMENDHWHNFFMRPACVIPMAVGFLLVYEGSDVSWRDPVYNIATGLAYTPDLKTYYDLTPDGPLLTSTTPGDYRTWRYSHWLPVGDTLYVYFEATRPNNTNEIRMAVVNNTLTL